MIRIGHQTCSDSSLQQCARTLTTFEFILCRPRNAFVKDYQALIAPTVGTPKPAGDIRLAYDGRSWLIEKHAVQVP